MNLYHVDTSEYGTYGSIVIADSEERAIELFLNSRSGNRPKKITASLLTDDLSKEYIQPEMVM